MANDTVQVLAEELLDEAVSALVCEGITPPARQMVTHGLPAWDCEQMTVHVDPPAFFRFNPRQPACQVAPQVSLKLTDLRCWPSVTERGKAPTADVLNDAAAAMNADLWVLMRTLGKHTADGSLFSQVSCEGVHLGIVQTLPPSGGFAGWQFEVIVQPQDIDPLCGS